MKNQENGNGVTLKNATKVSAKSTQTTKNGSLTVSAAAKSAAELVKNRLDKRSKLETLYQDIDQLGTALTEFNRISNYGDVKIVVSCGGHTFTTTRQDTVDSALQSIGTSIQQKLERAHADLAGFEF